MKATPTILLLASLTVHGEIIPANRVVDWTGAGVVGGVPNVTTIFTNLSAGSSLDSVNYSISVCPSNQVVLLGAGTFNFVGPINLTKSGVVLRGSGPTNTFLSINNSGGEYARIRIAGPDADTDVVSVDPPFVQNWTAGYTKGTTVITLASTTGLAIGRMLMLDQLNAPGVDGHGQEGCSYCGRNISGNTGPRAQFQGVTVTAVNGNQVTISPGIYMTNIASGLSPQAWAFSHNPVQMCGLENLTLTNLGGWKNNISFQCAASCWVSNVNSYNCYDDHVRSYFATHCQVSHSYFYGWQGVSQTDNYGCNWYYGWDNLCSDSIFRHIGQPLVIETAGQGNVFAFNYLSDLYYPADTTWLAEGAMTHAAGVVLNLFEGNYTPHCYMDRIHGGGMFNTVLRNVITGWESGRNTSTMAVAVQATNVYQQFVGNVLGHPGYHSQYATSGSDASNMQVSIWYLGFDGANGSATGFDSSVASTILRHGNYDVVTSTNGGVVWDSTIADHAVPNSLIYAGKPTWFGDRPWPSFDPANGSTISANANAFTNIPAGYRFMFGSDPAPASSIASSHPGIPILRLIQ
jgi:hypothetical protein